MLLLRPLLPSLVALIALVSFVPNARADDPQGRKDINAATASDLMAVKGIGEKTAEKILAHREDSGGYGKLADITGVKGIGRKTYAKLACHFYVPAEGVQPCEGQGGAGKKSRKSRPAIATAAAKVNINTATAEGLTRLPGIGPKKAERIVEHRAANGWFESADDLDEVNGFGAKTVERLAPMVETHLCVNSASEDQLRALGFVNATKILEFRKAVGGFASIEDLEQVPGTDDGALVDVEDILRFGKCP